jgi:phosphoribosyl-AMP cyclohydrolase
VIGNNGIGGYPATVFIYPKSEKRMLVVGYKNGEAMKDILAEMKNTYYAKK